HEPVEERLALLDVAGLRVRPRLLAGRETDEVRHPHRRLVAEQLAVDRAHARIDRRLQLAAALDVLRVLREVTGDRRTHVIRPRRRPPTLTSNTRTSMPNVACSRPPTPSNRPGSQ